MWQRLKRLNKLSKQINLGNIIHITFKVNSKLHFWSKKKWFAYFVLYYLLINLTLRFNEDIDNIVKVVMVHA